MKARVVRIAPALLVGLLVGLVVPAAAQDPGAPADPPTSWEEPSLEDALAGCSLVVHGRVVSAAAGTDPRVRVLATITGDAKPGDELVVHGTGGPRTLDALLRPLATGDEAVFLLRQEGTPDKPHLELPTPSFGRFPVRAGNVVACVRDSFVRVELPLSTYVELLRSAAARARGAAPEVAFIDSCRKTLATLEAASPDGAAVTAAHVALEGLRYGAEEKDVDLALRFFASPRYQVRISAARLLERAGGARAGSALLRLAVNDKERAVRSVALVALTLLRKEHVPQATARELVARLRELDATEITLHASVEDPRQNELPSNLIAAFETLRSIGAGAEASPVAVELLAKDQGDVLAAACLHLTKMRDRARVPEIVAKMRPADAPFSMSNELIGGLLEELTGEKLGPDRDAWRRYVAEKKGK